MCYDVHMYGEIRHTCVLCFLSHLILLLNLCANNSCLFLFSLFFFCSVRSVMYKYLEKENEISFDKIFNQILGKCCVFLYPLSLWTRMFANVLGSLQRYWWIFLLLFTHAFVYRIDGTHDDCTYATTTINKTMPWCLQAICYLKTFAKMHQKNRFHI